MSDPLSGTGNEDFFSASREPDQNDRLIPMINIVFLLLTFFMIAGTFHAAELLDVEPPEAPASGREMPQDGPVVLVSREGEMALGGERLDMDALVARLGARPGAKQAEVRVKADRAARVKVVLPLLKKLADAGLTHVQLVAVRRK
jgi:biopolymer transport protein ExbD